LDRLLSLFYYLKEQGRLPSTITLEAWVDKLLCTQDLMTAYFVPEMNDLTAPGYEIARASAHDLLARAIGNLEKCAAVGLAEAIDDTTQLFAWQTGILPPLRTAKYNPTRDRISPDEIPRPLRARIELLLEADLELYEKGRELFRTALAQMHAVVAAELGRPVDTITVRDHLRAQSRRRHAETMSGALPGDSVTWTPDDTFRGENLHSREEHNAERLRWTGPGKVTRFELYLGPARTWKLVVQLHRATPPAHVQAAELSVNGVPLTLERATDADGGFLIESRLGRPVAALAADGIATFELRTPVIRGDGEFRVLGVAIKSLTLRAV
jgi:hypothetical protein